MEQEKTKWWEYIIVVVITIFTGIGIYTTIGLAFDYIEEEIILPTPEHIFYSDVTTTIHAEPHKVPTEPTKTRVMTSEEEEYSFLAVPPANCKKWKDADGVGYTNVYVNNGTIYGTTEMCDNYQ